LQYLFFYLLDQNHLLLEATTSHSPHLISIQITHEIITLFFSNNTGSSGSGKSTMLRYFLLLSQPFTKDIAVRSRGFIHACIIDDLLKLGDLAKDLGKSLNDENSVLFLFLLFYSDFHSFLFLLSF